MKRAATKVSAKADLSVVPAKTKGFHSSRQHNTRYDPVGLGQEDWNSNSADDPSSMAMKQRQQLLEVGAIGHVARPQGRCMPLTDLMVANPTGKLMASQKLLHSLWW